MITFHQVSCAVLVWPLKYKKKKSVIFSKPVYYIFSSSLLNLFYRLPEKVKCGVRYSHLKAKCQRVPHTKQSSFFAGNTERRRFRDSFYDDLHRLARATMAQRHLSSPLVTTLTEALMLFLFHCFFVLPMRQCGVVLF